jgi:hypothetical protein
MTPAAQDSSAITLRAYSSKWLSWAWSRWMPKSVKKSSAPKRVATIVWLEVRISLRFDTDWVVSIWMMIGVEGEISERSLSLLIIGRQRPSMSFRFLIAARSSFQNGVSGPFRRGNMADGDFIYGSIVHTISRASSFLFRGTESSKSGTITDA